MSRHVIDFTRGRPPVDVFPVGDLIEAGNAAWRRDPAVLFQYGRSPGYRPLREWLGEVHGVGPDQVMIGNSSVELFGFISATLVRPGDRAFIETPTYDRSIGTLQRYGAQVVGIPLESDGLDTDVLEAECKKRAPKLIYMIADFQNPAGITTSAEKRQRVAELAREYQFWVVDDSPYRSLRYYGEPVPTVRSFAPDRVLQLNSFSKILSPGLRLGYLLGPADKIADLAAWAVETYIGPVLPTQGMVYEYGRRGLLEANIEKLNKLYRPRLDAVGDALAKYLPDATWARPEGGFFVGLHLPERKGFDMDALLSKAPGAGLMLSDGRIFFTNPADGGRFLRIPFCSVTEADLDEGVKRLVEMA